MLARKQYNCGYMEPVSQKDQLFVVEEIIRFLREQEIVEVFVKSEFLTTNHTCPPYEIFSLGGPAGTTEIILRVRPRAQSLGGKARAEKLTPGKRSEIARKGAAARWKKT